MSRSWFYLFLSITLLFSGCSFGTSKTEKNTLSAATDIDGMLKEGPGTYAGKQYDTDQVLQELEKLPENLSTEEAYNELIQLLAEDYQPIDKTIDEFDPSIQVKTSKPGDISRPENETHLNVVILLDASGSMAERVDGKTRMDLAKSAVQSFASSLPSDVHVGLRVYGHKGSNSRKDKEVSCNSNELVYPLKKYDEAAFQKALDRFQPTGWTPLAAAIESAGKDLEKQSSTSKQNVVYVVSDGEETCGGDPVAAARSLYESNIQAIVNIIGFDVDDAGQKALKQAADAGGGSYETVTDERDLSQYFTSEYEILKEKWTRWRKDSEKQVDDRDTINQNELHELAYKDALELVDKENQRLLDATKALKELGKIEDNYVLMQKVGKRKEKLKSHFIDRKNKIGVLVRQEQEERLKEIRETEKQEQKKIDEELEDLN
ncbi:VWA domain-containing protein [Desmospora profundinema]|uniref:D-amino-acid dehydrogenase/Ca-activated chloride channel family protein n=1 Tax=Desmospora profundinema TaxID=1571184 RepID=A0ABU1IQR4_9BACL|nr:VWA domain-containing protein [Desmospora profundinema]MDR6227046.1 D-amino-acid dehydrogenase/Ca-activated chloride channel family protein [Desmospora profundinema]